MSAGYMLGRQRKKLVEVAATGGTVKDALFVAERFDGRTLNGMTFEHCTFANISFLKTKLQNCRFLNCVFLNCYMRLADIDSAFPASRFISCDFARSTLGDNVDFQDYTYWEDCYIKYDELEGHLPARLNIRVGLANNMAHETEIAGESRDARRYRLLAIRSWEAHCWRIVRLSDSSYRSKYTGQRWDGLFAFLKSKSQGWIWGYGERASVPFIGFMLLTIILYPFLYWLRRSHLDLPDEQSAGVIDALLFSVNNVLQDVSIGQADGSGSILELLAASQVVVGYLYAGIFVALLLKAGTRR